MRPPPGEGGGWRKRRAFACIPSVDYPLSLFLGFSPLFMRLLMTLILIPDHFRAKISIEGLFLCWVFFPQQDTVSLYGRLLVILHSLCARRVKCSVKQTRALFLHLVPFAETSLQISGHGLRLYKTEKWRNVKSL